MASGYKDGQPPPRLYVIKSDWEIRYYTTPQTFAQAVVDGYADIGSTVLAVYELREGNPKLKVQQVMQANPAPPYTYPVVAGRGPLDPPTPEQRAYHAEYNAATKAWRKKVKALLVKAIERL